MNFENIPQKDLVGTIDYLNDIHIQNLRTLTAWIKSEEFNKVEVDMTDYVRNETGPSIDGTIVHDMCGATACLLGWTPTIPGMVYDAGDLRGYPDVSRKVYGVPSGSSVWVYLFGVCQSPEQLDCAARVSKFLAAVDAYRKAKGIN